MYFIQCIIMQLLFVLIHCIKWFMHLHIALMRLVFALMQCIFFINAFFIVLNAFGFAFNTFVFVLMHLQLHHYLPLHLAQKPRPRLLRNISGNRRIQFLEINNWLLG